MTIPPCSRTQATCLALLLSSLLGVACATPPRPISAQAPHATLVSSERLGPPMLLRQQLRGEYQGKHFDFECVLQVSQGELTIIGLTPFGSRAFVLSQRGVNYTFTKLVDRELPFDPVHILEDVHRVFFRNLPAGASEGVYAGTDGPERVVERWSQSVLKQRTFERLDQHPSGYIRITYGGPKAPLVSTHVTIDNGWYGYRLEIESIVQQLL